MSWSFEPGTVLPLAFTGMLYLRGARVSRGVDRTRQICFWTGWLVLTLALVSPIDTLGESLFSAHMAQHESLILIAAPLLTVARPLVPMLWGMPIEWRRRLGQFSKLPVLGRVWCGISRPGAAWGIHAAALWLWHIPQAFQATLTNEWIHAAQHLSFFGSALLFWWSLFYGYGRAGYGAGFLGVFTTAVHTSVLGALLTFAHTPWYPAYASTTAAWGLTPLEDQQLGGLIMWIPAGVIYLAVGLALFAMWLQESDAAESRRSYAH